MGRKSALTPDQWVEVERRHFVDGQSINSLAKEFGINEANIRRKIKPNNAEGGKPAKSLIQLAKEKVAADNAAKRSAEEIALLPIVRQTIVGDLARKLTNISTHMASGAEYSAATYHRLSALANQEVAKVDDAEPLKDGDTLRGIAALTALANEAAKTPINLIAANKEIVKDALQDSEPGTALMTWDDFYGDASKS